MTKAAYVGVLTEAPEYEETNATITSESDVGKYFTVEDSSYPFSWNTASTGLITYKSDSAANISGNRTYTSTWTAICDIDKLSFDWNSFAGGSASGSPYFEITVAGEQVVYRTMAGEGSWEGALSAGDEIVFTHYKQIYDTTYSYVTNVSLYCRTQTGTTIKGIARKIKKGYIGVGGIANRRLPEGYTQAEYVESDGASYFDTGFVPNQDTKVMMDALIPTEPSSIAVLFGARPNEGSSSDCVMVLRTASGVVRSYYDDSYKDMSGVDSLALLSVLKDKASTNVNGVTATHTYAEFSSAGSLFLSAMNAGGVATWHAALRIYSCSVYDNDKTVRFYVPCISPDGVVGLFDLASMEFNAGVGSFTAGPAVATEEYNEQGIARKIKKAYIGVGGVARPFWAGGELAYYGTVTSLTTARLGLAAASVGEYAVFAGGGTTSVEAYDESLSKSTPSAISKAATYLAGASNGEYAVFAGGKSKSASAYYGTVFAYDASLTKVTIVDESANSLYATAAYLGAASFGRYVIFAGGLAGSTVEKAAYAYDENLTATQLSSLSTARQSLAGTATPTHAIFAGGSTTSGYSPSNVVDAYDSNLTKTTAATLSTSRLDLNSAAVGEHAVIAGGRGSTTTTLYSDVDAYDSNLTKTAISGLSTARQSMGSVSGGTHAIFAGGVAKSGTTTAATNVVDAYDESLTHIAQTGLSQSRSLLAGTVVGEFALFAGGTSGSASTGLSAVDAYTLP